MDQYFRIFAGLLILVGMTTAGQAQYDTSPNQPAQNFQWPDGVKAAVSLSFDDARSSQLDNGIPILDTYGIKATFYVVPGNMEQRAADWKQAAAKGHELGNHSLTHPCTGNFAFASDKALEGYTLQEMARELDEANRQIQAIAGVRPKTFAYPCGQTFVGRGLDTRSYVPLVAERFLAGRLWLSEDANNPAFCDLAQVLGMESDGKSFAEIKTLIDKAVQDGAWLVLAGHDIGPPARQTTLATTLEAFCQYATEHTDEIWVAPVQDVAGYIAKHRANVP